MYVTDHLYRTVNNTDDQFLVVRRQVEMTKRVTTQDLIGRGQYNISCSRTMWIISIGLLDPLTCRQSSMFGTFSASVYDREFHDQERSKLWAQPCRRSGGEYPSNRLPDSSGVCVVVVWPAQMQQVDIRDIDRFVRFYW